MAANIGTLVANVELNNKNFLAAVKKSTLAFAAFSGALIAGAAKMAGAIRDNIDSISDLKDTADRLGTTVPTLQKLNYAAEQSGLSSAELTKALDKLNKEVGKTALAGDMAHIAIGKMTLQGRELANMSLEERFLKIADAIKQIESPTEQAAEAQKLFGRSGSKLLVLMKDDVGNLMQRFKDLGGTITSEGAAKVEALGDKFNDVKVVWQGFMNQMTISLVGPLEAITDFGIELGKSFETLKPLWRLLADVSGISVLLGIFGSISNILDEIIIKLEQLVRVSLAVPKVVGATIGGIQEKLGLGVNEQFQKAFDADQALATDIARRKQNIATGTRGIQTQQQKSKLDVKVSADKGFKIDVTQVEGLDNAATDIFYEQVMREAQRSGIR